MSEYWGQHWGEIPPIGEVCSGIAAVDSKQLGSIHPQLQSLKVDLLSKQNQESNETYDCNESTGCRLRVRDVPIGNPVMLHTIKLLKFINQLNDNDLRQQLSRESIPKMIETNENQRNVFKINEKELNEISMRMLLRRSVIIITKFHGYDFTQQSIIDLLVDILSEYLLRLCQTIRSTNDSLELMSSHDFIDVIDRVFHDINVSDFESLRQYDSDIRLYNQNLIKEINKKFGINESLNGTNKIRNSFNLEPIGDNCVNTQTDVKEIEPTLSLKSLLSSVKTNNLEEAEQFFDLGSLRSDS